MKVGQDDAKGGLCARLAVEASTNMQGRCWAGVAVPGLGQDGIVEPQNGPRGRCSTPTITPAHRPPTKFVFNKPQEGFPRHQPVQDDQRQPQRSSGLLRPSSWQIAG